jgi:hypothetical protein
MALIFNRELATEVLNTQYELRQIKVTVADSESFTTFRAGK